MFLLSAFEKSMADESFTGNTSGPVNIISNYSKTATKVRSKAGLEPCSCFTRRRKTTVAKMEKKA